MVDEVRIVEVRGVKGFGGFGGFRSFSWISYFDGGWRLERFRKIKICDCFIFEFV